MRVQALAAALEAEAEAEAGGLHGRSEGVVARLRLEAEVRRLHEAVGDESRKRMRLEKIVSKLMKELRGGGTSRIT